MCTCACIAGGAWAEEASEASEILTEGASEILTHATPPDEDSAEAATEEPLVEPVRKKGKPKSAQIALEWLMRVRGIASSLRLNVCERQITLEEPQL